MQSRAFTLLEVLLSLFLLFTMGLALIKFDGWIKKEITRYIEKAQLLFTASSILYQPLRNLDKERISLYDTIRLPKLTDSEIFWLKQHEISSKTAKMEQKTLYKNDEIEINYHILPLRIFDEKASIGFIKVLP